MDNKLTLALAAATAAVACDESPNAAGRSGLVDARAVVEAGAGQDRGIGVDGTAGDAGSDTSSLGTPLDCAEITPVAGRPPLTAVTVSNRLRGVVDVAFPPGDDRRIFALEYQEGRVRLIKDGALEDTPFLDLSDRVLVEEREQGLLSIAFHPNYASNRKLFLYYTSTSCPLLSSVPSSGCTRITEYQRSASDPDHADARTARDLLNIGQPAWNHNGGTLRFGPDGFLYASIGDGGSDGGASRVPGGYPQDPSRLLGKLLRIDVNRQDAGKAYAVPPTNPFVGDSNYLPEILHLGLRNPWRFSFDRLTGELWIGDVGAGRWEETIRVASGVFGQNFGWPCFEGQTRRNSDGPCASASLTAPYVQHAHEGANYQSIVGGVRYRGCKMPGYRDTYFYADLRLGLLSFQVGASGPANDGPVSSINLSQIVGLAEDHHGEIYIMSLNNDLLRLEPAL